MLVGVHEEDADTWPAAKQLKLPARVGSTAEPPSRTRVQAHAGRYRAGMTGAVAGGKAMTVADAQREVRSVFLGGLFGQVVSGAIRLLSAASSPWGGIRQGSRSSWVARSSSPSPLRRGCALPSTGKPPGRLPAAEPRRSQR